MRQLARPIETGFLRVLSVYVAEQRPAAWEGYTFRTRPGVQGAVDWQRHGIFANRRHGLISHCDRVKELGRICAGDHIHMQGPLDTYLPKDYGTEFANMLIEIADKTRTRIKFRECCGPNPARMTWAASRWAWGSRCRSRRGSTRT